MTVPADELAELHTALRAGTWQRLTDPRLWLLVLDRPDRWEEIVHRCSLALAVEAFTGDPSAVEQVVAWMHEVGGPETEAIERALRSYPADRVPLSTASLMTVLRAGSDDRRQRAYLPLVRRAVARHPSPEREAALAVLERWPLG